MDVRVQKRISYRLKSKKDNPVTEVLIVEDNPDDVDMTLRAFKKFKLMNKIQVVRTGEEAIDFVRAGRHNLNIIILDINLPKMSGYDVLNQLKGNAGSRKIPIVVLTINDHDETIEKCYKLGANSYIVKPVDFHKFAEVVSTLGFYWCFLNEQNNHTGNKL